MDNIEKFSLKFFYSELMDDKKLIEWLMKSGMISEKYKCPMCQSEMRLIKVTRGIDKYYRRCYKKGENAHDVSRIVRRGTWFESCKLSMRVILGITYLWSMNASNELIMSEFDVSQSVLENWKHYCRDVCVEMVLRENDQLGGPGKIVEIDETKFCKRKYQRENFVDGKWVFGGVEIGTDKCFMVVAGERSKAVLLDVIKVYVLPGSTVVSDCWKSYDCLHDEGYVYLTTKHSYKFKHPETGAHTKSMEGTWYAIKTSLRSKYNKASLEDCLFEYIFRRKHKNEKLLVPFLKAVNEVYPPAMED